MNDYDKNNFACFFETRCMYRVCQKSNPVGRIRYLWKCSKFGELWSTNQKVIDAHVDPLKWTCFGILNFGR